MSIEKVGFFGFGSMNAFLANSEIVPEGVEKLFYDPNVPESTDANASKVELDEFGGCDLYYIGVNGIHYRGALPQLAGAGILPGAAIVNMCSVQKETTDICDEELPDQPAVHAHFVFGPQSVAKLGLPGRRVALTRHTPGNPIVDETIGRWKRVGLEVDETNADKHDKEMLSAQAIVFVMARLAKVGGFDPEYAQTPSSEAVTQLHSLDSRQSDALLATVAGMNPYFRGTPLHTAYLELIQPTLKL